MIAIYIYYLNLRAKKTLPVGRVFFNKSYAAEALIKLLIATKAVLFTFAKL